MNTEKKVYRQKTFFHTGLPLLVISLPILLTTLYALLHNIPLHICILGLLSGLILVIQGARQGKKETTRLREFIRKNSSFTHKCRPPLTLDKLLALLKQEGFELTAYPYGNYYAYCKLDNKYDYHCFLANNDTPDCPEAEAYSKLFIQTVWQTGQAAGKSYILNLEYGADLPKKAGQYLKNIRDGFMCDKNGFWFGFRIAYDTKENILYCAEAITNVIWHQSEQPTIYTCRLLQKFLSY